MYYCYLATPIGDLLLAGDEEALTLVGFPQGSMRRDPEPDWIYNEKPFAEVRRQLMEQLISANGVPAPRSLADRVISAYARGYSVPDEKLEEFAGEFRPMAEAQVRRDLVLDHVAKAQDLRATEAELDEKIADLAKRRNVEPGEVYTQLQKAGQLKELELRITEDKVWDYLLSQSTVTES